MKQESLLKRIICRIFHWHRYEIWAEHRKAFYSFALQAGTKEVVLLVEELTCRDCGRLIYRKENGPYFIRDSR